LQALQLRIEEQLKAKEYAKCLSDFNLALKDCRKVRMLGFDSLLAQRAEALSSMGRTNESVADLRAAIKLNPRNDRAHNALGCHYSQFSDPISLHNAIEYLDKAIEINNQAGFYFGNRARVKMLVGNYREALEDASEAIKLDPTLIMAYVDRGYAHQALHRPGNALDDFKRAASLDPDFERENVSNGIASASLALQQQDLWHKLDEWKDQDNQAMYLVLGR
jgi:tetratricopeptide (TPR) repeat protein